MVLASIVWNWPLVSAVVSAVVGVSAIVGVLVCERAGIGKTPAADGASAHGRRAA